MAQGKAFTEEQRNTIIQSLQAYLELGFSRNKACELTGLAPATLSNWVKADEALGIKLQSWENAISTTAMANIRDAIQKESESEDARKETSKWWLERKMRQDFSVKTETDVTSKGEKLAGATINILKPNGNSIQADSETVSGVGISN
jgi:hypothetical protein